MRLACSVRIWREQLLAAILEYAWLVQSGKQWWTVAEVSPALDRYATVDELVAAYYDFAVRADVERASQLADGRILNYATVEDAAFWGRYTALTATTTAHPGA